jgi:hypothetical protein
MKYDSFMNDNIQSLKTGYSTNKVLYVVGSPQEEQANMATTSPSTT